jgi:SAM-dependent methyltransferase
MQSDAGQADTLYRWVNRSLHRGYGWACERLYHELAWSYDRVSWLVSAGAWDGWRRLALDECGATTATERPALELGFGTGALLQAAQRAGQPIVGLELSPAMHAVAAARLAAYPSLAPPRVQATALALPFQSSSFAAVLATFPTRYILARATLDECARVLCLGGRLIIVGLWVVPVFAGRRLRLPLLYGALDPAQTAAITQRIAAAGFAVTLHTRRAAEAEVGVLVGEKQSIV